MFLPGFGTLSTPFLWSYLPDEEAFEAEKEAVTKELNFESESISFIEADRETAINNLAKRWRGTRGAMLGFRPFR